MVCIYNKMDDDLPYYTLWRFDGKTGDTEGTISFVGESVDKGIEIMYSKRYLLAVYPADTTLEFYTYKWSSLEYPKVQKYQADSYGAKTNIMMAVSKESMPQNLNFKNLMGYVKLQLTGTETVTSIELRGNNNEILYGDVSLYEGTDYNETNHLHYKLAIENIDFYTETSSDSKNTTVILDCGEGVVLSPETPTDFYIGILPNEFKNGFTATIHFSDGSTETKYTSNEISVARNHIVPMEQFLCSPQQVPDDEIWYTTTTGKVLTLSVSDGFGANIVSNTYSNGKGVIKFDGPVTAIGPNIFQGKNLSSIILPDTITEIGENAFSECSNLYKILLPDNLNSIGASAFSSNDQLLEINIPDNVTAIYEDAFRGSYNIQTIDLPQNLTYIGERAFMGCESADITDYELPSGLTYIGNSAFESTAITRASIPTSIGHIGSWAFAECKNLKEIYFPNNITEIPYGIFSGCSSLESFEISSNVTIIQDSAFEGCSSLSEINIPSGITILGSYAFSGCGIENVSIPEGLKLKYSEEGLFKDCKKLTRVNLPADFELHSETFSGCTNLREITIPEITKTLYDELFKDCSSLEHINIPSGVTSIGEYVFSGCSSLDEVALPSGLTSIGKGTFYGCSSLTEIDIPSGITCIEGYTFTHCSSLKRVNIPNTVTLLRDHDDNGIGYSEGIFEGCTSLMNIELPNSITGKYPNGGICVIPSQLFKGCLSLESIDISMFDVRILYHSTFEGCSNLKSIKLSETLYQIYPDVFNGCSSLASISLPAGMKQIDVNAFNGCSSLHEIYCKATTPPSLATASVFTGTPSDMKIYVPTETLDAYKSAKIWGAMAGKLVGYDF